MTLTPTDEELSPVNDSLTDTLVCESLLNPEIGPRFLTILISLTEPQRGIFLDT